MIDKEGKKKIRRILFAKIPVDTILAIEGEPKFIRELYKAMPDFAQSYIHNMVKKFKDNGMIKTKKSGRKVFVSLTKDGQRFVNVLRPVMKKWCDYE